MVFGGHCPKGPGESFMGRGCIRPMRCHETLVFLPSHTFTAHCCVLFLQKDETAADKVGKKILPSHLSDRSTQSNFCRTLVIFTTNN